MGEGYCQDARCLAWLPSHPRPLILKMPSPLSLTLHTSLIFIFHVPWLLIYLEDSHKGKRVIRGEMVGLGERRREAQFWGMFVPKQNGALQHFVALILGSTSLILGSSYLMHWRSQSHLFRFCIHGCKHCF
jgi:hypothetical protein